VDRPSEPTEIVTQEPNDHFAAAPATTEEDSQTRWCCTSYHVTVLLYVCACLASLSAILMKFDSIPKKLRPVVRASLLCSAALMVLAAQVNGASANKKEHEKTRAEVKQTQEQTNQRLDAMQKDVDELKSSFDELKNNFDELKNNVDELKNNVDELKNDFDDIKEDTKDIKTLLQAFVNNPHGGGWGYHNVV